MTEGMVEVVMPQPQVVATEHVHGRTQVGAGVEDPSH